MVARSQLALFSQETLGIDESFASLRRLELADGAWLDYGQDFLRGHELLLQELVGRISWRQEKRISARYGENFSRLSLGYYRSGQDSVAWHGDYVARRLPSATVATISVGAPRTFQLRRKSGRDRITLALGWGDLLVMGGTCQRTWEHAVPKTRQAAARIAIMFRPVWHDPAASLRRPGSLSD